MIRHSLFLLFPFEVVGHVPLYDRLLGTFPWNRPFAAIGIITGITARIIGDNIISEILFTGVCQLMRLARSEEERVTRSHIRSPVFVSNASVTRDDEIQLRLRAVRVVGTIRLPFRNPHYREVEWMPLCQIERRAVS